jgi:hypothetical protein
LVNRSKYIARYSRKILRYRKNGGEDKSDGESREMEEVEEIEKIIGDLSLKL